ncbi:MAG: ABC transporter substrate-binding protein [Deltaproteobacteria bacterium]|nr:ABC transporter substrate-binding protein [Deltaproteobacteria bacterium]
MLAKRSWHHFLFSGLLVVVLVLGGSAVSAGALGPMGVVKSGTDRALGILKSQQTGEGQKIRHRRGEILQIVDEYFNFQEMARRALGRPWKEQPREKQEEFVRLFKDLLFNTYVDRVESYTAGDERVSYDEERIEGDYASVRTRVSNTKTSNVTVEYRLRKVDGEWKVYDVIVEGISFIDNYRSQFSSILMKESFDSLLNRMRQRVSENAVL